MPQPQLPPQQPVVQQQQQQQQQQVAPSNEIGVTNDGESNSNARSDAKNYVTNSASLSSYQVNSNHESTYFKYRDGTTIPGTSIYGDISVIRNDWDRSHLVAKVGIRHTFGGKAKKLAYEGIKRDNISRSLAMCKELGIFDGKLEVDYNMLPELKDCQFIKQKTVVPTNQVVQARTEFEEMRLMIRKQQETIEALKLRLIQMQHQAPVRVGG